MKYLVFSYFEKKTQDSAYTYSRTSVYVRYCPELYTNRTLKTVTRSTKM